MYLLGIDLGSSSVKVAIVDTATQSTVALAHHPKAEMPINAPEVGWAEQDPEDWWISFKSALKEVLETSGIDKNEILGIGIAYQMHGLVLVDKNQDVLRPAIIWCDGRATTLGDGATEKIGLEKCLGTYLNTLGNFTAAKLKWVKENEPEVYKQADKMLLPGDYLAMRMTGVTQTSVTGLSEAILWNFEEHKLATEVLNAFELSEKLVPEIVETFSIQSRLSKEIAAELGLAEGTPISYRAGDQPNNAFSLGVIDPDTVAATGGTSGVVYGLLDKPKTDAQARVNAFAHVNHEKTNPRIGLLLCINGAGSQYGWIKKQMSEDGVSYAAMENAANKITVGSDGLMILPFGNGSERMLSHNYQGASISNLQFNVHGKAHFYRATLEGIAFSFVYGLEIMRDLGMEIKKMNVGNDNLFQSNIFSKTIANLTNTEINVIETTGAIGAAKGAGLGIKYYKDIEQAIGRLSCIKNYHPDKERDKYIPAYENWKRQLEKQYKI